MSRGIQPQCGFQGVCRKETLRRNGASEHRQSQPTAASCDTLFGSRQPVRASSTAWLSAPISPLLPPGQDGTWYDALQGPRVMMKQATFSIFVRAVYYLQYWVWLSIDLVTRSRLRLLQPSLVDPAFDYCNGGRTEQRLLSSFEAIASGR